MKSVLRILCLLSVLSVAVPNVAFGDDKPAKSEKKGKSDFTSLYAQVDSITDSLLTVKGEGADTKFVINADTKISKSRKDKTAVPVADIKAGQWVGGSYTKGADGTNTLHSLHTDVDQNGKGGKKKKEAK